MKSIGEVSRLCEVGIETIRYYEREGIVPKPHRLPNGRRVYDEDGVARLGFVKRCRDLGFPMKDVRSLQKLAFTGDGNCEAVAEIGKHNVDLVRRKIRYLVKLERALSELVAECKGNPKRCPMLDHLLLD